MLPRDALAKSYMLPDFNFILSIQSCIQNSIICMYLTSNAKLKFRKCQFAATVSLFWKQWRVPVGHLQRALFSTWYRQRSTAAEVQKPLPKWLECGLWAGVDLLYLRCSSWSFSFSLAYNSALLTLLWLTCGLVFPATVQSKNGSCR